MSSTTSLDDMCSGLQDPQGDSARLDSRNIGKMAFETKRNKMQVSVLLLKCFDLQIKGRMRLGFTWQLSTVFKVRVSVIMLCFPYVILHQNPLLPHVASGGWITRRHHFLFLTFCA